MRKGQDYDYDKRNISTQMFVMVNQIMVATVKVMTAA
jgi:hypothetical protein